MGGRQLTSRPGPAERMRPIGFKAPEVVVPWPPDP
jgi:hypothetical protein